MLFQFLSIIFAVIIFKKIIQWLFGENANILNFAREVFNLIGKLIGSILIAIWKIIRFIFQLLIYKRN